MSNDDLEIIIAGGAGRSAAAADHIALALMGAGASWISLAGRTGKRGPARRCAVSMPWCG